MQTTYSPTSVSIDGHMGFLAENLCVLLQRLRVRWMPIASVWLGLPWQRLELGPSAERGRLLRPLPPAAGLQRLADLKEPQSLLLAQICRWCSHRKHDRHKRTHKQVIMIMFSLAPANTRHVQLKVTTSTSVHGRWFLCMDYKRVSWIAGGR